MRNKKYYLIVWAILVVLYNVIVFVIPDDFGGYNKYGGAFWPAYIFIMIAFVLQLICALYAFRDSRKEKLFLNVPLVRISYAGLIVMIIIATICMVIVDLPKWIAVIVCFIVLAVYAISVIKASAAASIVSGREDSVKKSTQGLHLLIEEARDQMEKANGESKIYWKEIYEALRYSDPVSIDEVMTIEEKIHQLMQSLELDRIRVDEIISLIKKRNSVLKNRK